MKALMDGATKEESVMLFAESFVLFASVVAFVFVAGSFLPTPVEVLYPEER